MAKSTRRKRSAWGSITEKERGRRYVIRYYATTDERGYMRHSETVRGTRADAERRRAELLLDHSADAPCPTVAQAWERWCWPDLERQCADGDLAPLTLKQYEKNWRLYIAPRWADVPLDQVRPLHVQQWISTMKAGPAGQSVRAMARIMDYGVRYEVIGHNPMRERYVMPSKSTIERADKGVWKLQELDGVWQRVRGQWWEPAFLLAAFGGCRLGESMAPLASDVSRAEVDGITVALVAITCQVAPSGTDVVRCKTPQSVRTVALVGLAAERILALAADLPPDCPLTNDGLGGHQRQSRMKEAWRQMRMEHPFRNLRNGWQTWMRWDMKVEPHFIEAMMGHRVAGVTGAHYDRPDAEQFARVMADAYRRNRYDEKWAI